MRRSILFAGLFLLPITATARDWPILDRFAQRAPLPHRPVPHTMERAGYPQEIHNHAVPSVTRFDQPGYIGGGSLKNNNLLARGPVSAVGPTQDGTFGTDFGGFRMRLGRVFLAPSTDPSRGEPIGWRYNQEGPRVTDVFALRPFRKAVLEKHEDMEERKHGKEGHGEGGHAPEGGH